MYFTFRCPHCDKKLKVREEITGRKAGCPYCKTSFIVPSPPSDSEPEEKGPESFEGIDVSGTSSLAAGRGRRKLPPRSPKHTPSGSSRSDRTDVSMLTSGLAGLVIAAAFVLLVWPFADSYFGELFFKRGWVPYALVFLLGWSVAILVLKSRKLKRQRASMLFDLLPNELSAEITEESLGKFLKHIDELPVEPGESFLINRVVRGLEHFRARNSNPEVANMLASQSEIDANAVQSSYTLLNVFIWAIPILGFIGTVIGISAAVRSFSGSLEQAQDISVLKDSLNNVTGGLATAFDTTLIALVMSMLVMFPSSSMQKSEEDLLNWVDEYCNENLLKRLNDGNEGGGNRDSPINSLALRKAVNAALAPHHAELETWTKKLTSIGAVLTDQVVEGWNEINEKVQERQDEHVAQIDDLDIMVAQFQHTLTDLTQQTETVHNQAADSMSRSADSLRAYCTALEQGLRGLNDVLGKLGEKQVVVQREKPPRRRRWLFRRNDEA